MVFLPRSGRSRGVWRNFERTSMALSRGGTSAAVFIHQHIEASDLPASGPEPRIPLVHALTREGFSVWPSEYARSRREDSSQFSTRGTVDRRLGRRIATADRAPVAFATVEALFGHETIVESREVFAAFGDFLGCCSAEVIDRGAGAPQRFVRWALSEW